MFLQSDILEGHDGAICRMDDILIHGRNQIEHDIRVRAVLFCLQKAGLTLKSVSFLKEDSS